MSEIPTEPKRRGRPPGKYIRTAEHVKKWKDTIASSGHGMNLSDDHKIVICTLLSSFKTSQQIAAYFKESHNITITFASIRYYLTAPGWKPMIDRMRAEYVQQIAHIPISHKRMRLERLEEQWVDAEQVEARSLKEQRMKRTELRAILKDAKEECVPDGDKGNTNIFAFQFNGMDEKELLKRKEILLTRITKIGGASGRAIQEDSPGGSRQRIGEIRGERELAIDPEWLAAQGAKERVGPDQEA